MTFFVAIRIAVRLSMIAPALGLAACSEGTQPYEPVYCSDDLPVQRAGIGFRGEGVYHRADSSGDLLYCFLCEGGPEDGGWGSQADEEAIIEITAIDDEHVAGCIVGTPAGACSRQSVAFDVPCGARVRAP